MNRTSSDRVDNSCSVDRSNLWGDDSSSVSNTDSRGSVTNTDSGGSVSSRSNGVVRSIAVAISTGMVFTDNVFWASNSDIGSNLMCYWFNNLGSGGNVRSLSGRCCDISDDVRVVHGVFINMLVMH